MSDHSDMEDSSGSKKRGLDVTGNDSEGTNEKELSSFKRPCVPPTVETLSKRLDSLEGKIVSLEETSATHADSHLEMASHITKMKDTINREAEYSRSSNLLIFGIQRNPVEMQSKLGTMEVVMKFLNDNIVSKLTGYPPLTPMSFSKVHRMPPKRPGDIHPIMVRFVQSSSVETVINNGKYLKDYNKLNSNKVSLRRHHSAETSNVIRYLTLCRSTMEALTPGIKIDINDYPAVPVLRVSRNGQPSVNYNVNTMPADIVAANGPFNSNQKY